MPRDLLADYGDSVDLLPDYGNTSQLGSSLLQKLGYPTQGIGRNLAENISSLANSTGIHAIQGAQDAFQRNITGGLVNPTPQGEGGAYNLGKYGGDILAAYLGGKALGPVLGKVVRPLIQSDTVQNALSTLQPNKSAQEIIKDLGNNSILVENEVLPGMAGEISSPRKGPSSDDIRTALSRNAKSVAKDISSKFNEHNTINKEQYESVFNDTNRVGDRRLQISKTSQEDAPSRLIPKKVSETFAGGLEDEYLNYLDNPSVKNAHDFQSELGFAIRDLKNQKARGNLSISDSKILGEYEKSHKAMQGAIKNTLTEAERSFGEDYLTPYLEANKYHYENIVPYKLNSTISQIAHGKITNPKSIPTLFKNPEEHIQKITEDLGDEFKNKILFSELGKLKGNTSSEKLLKAYADLDKKGLSDYISDELLERFSTLEKRNNRKNIARSAAGIVGGGLLGSAIGLPYGKELGAAGGYFAAPAIEKILKGISKR